MDASHKNNDNDVMMESTTSEGSETSSVKQEIRERRESTSSNPSSDVLMMPPSPVSREQVKNSRIFDRNFGDFGMKNWHSFGNGRKFDLTF